MLHLNVYITGQLGKLGCGPDILENMKCGKELKMSKTPTSRKKSYVCSSILNSGGY